MENDEQSTSIDTLTLCKQVPYRDLDILFDKHGVLGNDAGTMYVLCNLFPIIRGLLSDYHQEVMDRQEMQEHPWRLAYNLLRMIIHYRWYLHTRYSWRSIFIFYHSTEKCLHKTSVFPDYCKRYYDKALDTASSMKDYINKNLSFMHTYLNGIPGAYLLDTKVFDPEAFPEVTRRRGGAEMPILVLSGSINDLQLVEQQLSDRKEAGKIYVINHPIGSSRFSFGSETSYKDLLDISGGSCYYTTLVGEKSFSVPGWPLHAEKKISRWIRNHSGYLNFKSQTLDEMEFVLGFSSGSFDLDKIRKTWYCLNHREYVDSFYTEDIIIAMEKQMNDTWHQMSLEEVNREYFPFYPVDLPRIMAGEAV